MAPSGGLMVDVPPRYWIHGIDEALIADAVAHHTGARPHVLIRKPAKAPRVVYEAAWGGENVIFKGEHDTEGDDAIVLEAWACERVREAGVPAPGVIALDTSERIFPGRFAIFERVAGVALSGLRPQLDERRAILHEVGRVLKRIHGVRVDGGYGRLDDNVYLRTGKVRGMHTGWIGGPALDALGYVARRDLLASGDCEAIQRLFDEHRDVLFRNPEPQLLHGELDATHTFVDPSTMRVTGVIDFGDRESGDPAWDVAAIGVWDGHEALRYVVEGYDENGFMAEELRRKLQVYGAVRLLGIAQRRHAAGRLQDAASVLDLLHKQL